MPQEQIRSHAALMDDVYRHQRYIYDLTRKYYLFGRDSLIDGLELKPGSRVVEVGSGTGRNLVRIARRYPGANLYGLDASSEMLKSAERTLRRAGFAGRVRLAHGYAEELSPRMFDLDEPFDAVVFSYSLSMIPDWKQSLAAASRTLSPSGRIHIVDFGDLAGLGRIAERALSRWLGLFHVSPRVELLATFEQALRAGRGPDKLRLLPGRYAFIVMTGANGLNLLGDAVAAESQGPDKTKPSHP